MNVDVIIPALDEEGSVGAVVASIPRPPVREVIVADNGSRDRTAEVARAAGARVVRERRRGYGAACLAAMADLAGDCDLVIFLDGDGADFPEYIFDLIAPIIDGDADLVVGSRTLGDAEPGSMTPQQEIGNRIASAWLCRRFGLKATDLGPFRAIRRDALFALGMRDTNYGWTVEMQIKAARQGLRYAEVPVPYRCSRRPSKVSGTLRGTIGASVKIFGLLAYHDLRG